MQLLHPSSGQTRFSLADLLPNEHFHDVGRFFSFQITSWSMFPTIQKGDVIEIGAALDLRMEDIVVFERHGEIICHRLIGFGGLDEVYTKGDSEAGMGIAIRRTDILGKVRTLTRKGVACSLAQRSSPSGRALIQKSAAVFVSRLRGAIWFQGLKGFALLLRSTLVRRIAGSAIRAQVAFSLGTRAPLHVVRGCRLLPLPGAAGDEDWIAAVRTGVRASTEAVLVARFRHYWLGTIDLASAEVTIRPEVAGLGLEAVLRDLLRKVRS